MKRWLLAAAIMGVLGVVGALILSAGGVLAQDGGGQYTWQGTTKAPGFPSDLDWINTSAPLTMADLKGKIVLLDFWTYGCINCIHVIPDLERLEKEYPTQLVVIGVHSAKFDNEGETKNIEYIVRRYEITHPVVNDNKFQIWQAYGVNAWPTFMLIDPFGNVVGQMSGEPLYPRMQPIIDTMAKEYGDAGVLNLAPLPQIQPELARASDSPLLFPGKVLADAAGNRLFISDSNHNRIVVTSLDTYEVLDVIGNGTEGLVDGDYTTAEFYRPQGLTLDGNKLYVADTENHAIRVVDLDSRTISTAAGTGKQGFDDSGGPGPETNLNSPWDVVAVDGKVYIAMAGQHQLWVYDTASGDVEPYAGSGREGLDDGKLKDATMSQPSGLDSDGNVLYVADPEASAIRTADLNPDGSISTIVGTGLFDFGDVDGTGDEVRLQHALGLTVADDGYLYVADTYNSKIKRIDPATRESVAYVGSGVEGLVDGADAEFYEPGGIDYANGKLYVADTNNDAIRVVDMATKTVSTVEFPNVERLMPPVVALETSSTSTVGQGMIPLAPQRVNPGEGKIIINVTMPDGYKFNGLAPFTAIWPDDPIAQIPADSQDIRILHPEMPLEVPVTFAPGQTELTLNLTVYWCESVNESLCFVDRAELVMPLSVVPGDNLHTVTFDHALVPPVVEDTLG